MKKEELDKIKSDVEKLREHLNNEHIDYNATLDTLLSIAEKELTPEKEELSLLRRIAETSSDLVKATHYEEFCASMGGIGNLKHLHELSVSRYEEWVNDGDG